MPNIPNVNMPNNYFFSAYEPKKGVPTWLGLTIIIVISVIAGATILGSQYYIQNQNLNFLMIENPVIDFSALDRNKLLSKMFPNLEFENETAKLSSKDSDLKLSLKDSEEGYFLSRGEKSLLLIASLEGMPHVAGLYHAYVGLFDKDGNLLTPASSLPGADSGITIGDDGKGNSYDFEKDKAHFGADNGTFGFTSCSGIKRIVFISSGCPNSSCCYDSATVYRINEGEFEVAQKIEQGSYSVNYALKMSFSDNKLTIKKVPDHLDDKINECTQKDYKVLDWDMATCTFREPGQSFKPVQKL